MNKTQTAIVGWLANGRTGLSSEAMAFYLGFGLIRKEDGRFHPHDPSDFNRCLGLLRAAPGLRKKLPEMAKLSKAQEGCQTRPGNRNLRTHAGRHRRKAKSTLSPKLHTRAALSPGRLFFARALSGRILRNFLTSNDLDFVAMKQALAA
jgi:hypothetical protein